ncbi:prepilin-type N-terminal cleavage/methylation domain-containing protein (plasmid) [Tistrella mobilis]|uniref:prepilin-type N-terminal cleavage/methylation domain-containing protein n=1 Tax=Tistrella mobilis TaxID=171437 RepID=UPI0035560645
MRNEAGFTLIEVLVTLVVTALALSLLTGLTLHVRHQQAAATARASAAEGLLAAARVLRAVVVSAVPDPHWQQMAAEGQSDHRMIWLSPGPAVLALSSPVRITLDVTAEAMGDRLTMAWTDPEDGASRREPLIEGAHSIRFAYFDGPLGRPGSWRRDWPGGLSLPRGVLVRVEMAALGGPLDLVFRPTAEWPFSCRGLPQETRCEEAALQ